MVTMVPVTRILHLERHMIMRQIVNLFLSHDEFIALRSESPDKLDIVEAIQKHPVDIVIIGINLENPHHQGVSWTELCKQVSAKFPKIKILIHSAFDDPGHIFQIIKSGATGVISKKCGKDDFIRAVEEIHNNRTYVCTGRPDAYQTKINMTSSTPKESRHTYKSFSTREIEVLQLIARGLTTQDIGQRLSVGLKTVETHRKNLMIKAQVKNTAELITSSFAKGFL